MTPKSFDPREDEGYPAWLKAAHLDIAAQADARRAESDRGWDPPSPPSTLYEQLEEGVPEVDWVVKGLIPAGIVQINAQQKAGKTTLVLNIVRALLLNEPLLGRFDVNVAPDARVAYLNMELPKQHFLTWLADMQLTDDAAKRLDIYHARHDGFGVLDFRNDLAVDWLVTWLRDHGIDTLAADPLGALYNAAAWGTSDPNAAYLQWWARLEDVVRRAELRCVLIAHHTGFAETSADRARGASAMMDKPDVNMSYRHKGEHGGKPEGTTRYLSAFGRDVDVDEFEIDYIAPRRQLYATGEGNRRDVAVRARAVTLADKVTELARDGATPNKRELYEALGGKANGWSSSGDKAREADAAHQYAINEGWIATAPGSGNAKLHSPGACSPHEKVRVNTLAARTRKPAAKRAQKRPARRIARRAEK